MTTSKNPHFILIFVLFWGKMVWGAEEHFKDHMRYWGANQAWVQVRARILPPVLSFSSNIAGLFFLKIVSKKLYKVVGSSIALLGTLMSAEQALLCARCWGFLGKKRGPC